MEQHWLSPLNWPTPQNPDLIFCICRNLSALRNDVSCRISASPHFYASATDRCRRGIMFFGCPCVRACVRPGVHPVEQVENFFYKYSIPWSGFESREVKWRSPQGQMCKTPYLLNRLMDFDKITYVPRLDELAILTSSWGQGQGHSKVKYLSELLRRAEAYTSRTSVEVSLRRSWSISGWPGQRFRSDQVLGRVIGQWVWPPADCGVGLERS